MVRRAGKHLVTTPEESGELRLCRPRQGQGLALQFRMSVIGESVASSVGRLMRNRPSRETAYWCLAGLAVLPSASTYFLCVDLAASGIALDDEAFARLAVEKAGVAVVPLSPFAESDPPRHMIRLCFAKRDETIDAGVEAMAKARNLMR